MRTCRADDSQIMESLLLQASSQGRQLHPFFSGGFVPVQVSNTDPMTHLCKKHIEDLHQAQIVKFVSFTGALTGKYVVKSVHETCKTVHSTPKETCQYATQLDRPCKTACFWWVKETPKDAQECDLGLCKFVGYFHVFPSCCLRRRKGPAVPKRNQQTVHRKSLYIFQTHEDARGPHVINFLHLLLW